MRLNRPLIKLGTPNGLNPAIVNRLTLDTNCLLYAWKLARFVVKLKDLDLVRGGLHFAACLRDASTSIVLILLEWIDKVRLNQVSLKPCQSQELHFAVADTTFDVEKLLCG